MKHMLALLAVVIYWDLIGLAEIEAQLQKRAEWRFPVYREQTKQMYYGPAVQSRCVDGQCVGGGCGN